MINILEDFFKEVREEQNKIIDKCTINLLHKAGIKLKENYTNFELLLVSDELKRKGYILKFEHPYNNSYSNKKWLSLYKDNSLIAAYEFDIRIDENSVKILTIPIE